MRGLRDSNGQIVINEAEAEADIRKIEQAKLKLVEARRIINAKNLNSDLMCGSTRDALEEKLNKVERELSSWEEKCNSTVRYIRNVVARYKRIDNEYARRVGG